MQKITPNLWFDGDAEDAERSQRVTEALLQMGKSEISMLEEAYAR